MNDTDRPVIDLQNVSKRYGKKVWALDGVAMRVGAGEVFGLLGPNGAGKSTLVKILMTVVRPTRADGTMLGERIGARNALEQIGYLPEHARFPEYLTGRQTLDYYAAMAKVDRPTRRRRSQELLEAIGLKKWGDARVGTYSKGMRQRLGLAQALMNDPRLIFLDEPTDGLDPVGRNFVRQLLVQLREQGRTVFLNSHLLGEVEQVCDRVAILQKGQVLRQGRLDELTGDTARYAVRVAAPTEHRDWSVERIHAAIREAIDLKWTPEGAPLQATGRLASGESVRLDGAELEVATIEPAAVQDVIDRLRGKSLTIVSVAPKRQTLEELFLGSIDENVESVGAG